MYRLAESRALHPRANALLVNQRAELGDVVIGLHASFVPRLFQYQATVALTAPTGDEIYGLTSGRVTADFNNRFERTFAHLTPSLELGVGDSTTLINRLVTKNYTTLGPLAHFQSGLGLRLPRSVSFESTAYEQLPIGDQKIYGPARRGRGTVVIGRNAAEDNGLTTALDIPIDAHASFSGYYSRSLRLRVDSVAIGVTYILRAPPVAEPENDTDELFR